MKPSAEEGFAEIPSTAFKNCYCTELLDYSYLRTKGNESKLKTGEPKVVYYVKVVEVTTQLYQIATVLLIPVYSA